MACTHEALKLSSGSHGPLVQSEGCAYFKALTGCSKPALKQASAGSSGSPADALTHLFSNYQTTPAIMTLLQRLDQDVLTLIFEELRPGLHPLLVLSRTCHWLRDASAPVLFKYAGHGLNERILSRSENLFLPRAFWPYVRRMSLWCLCRNPVDSLSATDEVALCPAINHRLVKEALRNMPCLTRLRLQMGNLLKHGHGVSWRRINLFLSLPTLREFELVDLCVCSNLPDSPRVKTLAPVSSFQYNLYDNRSPWKLPAEDQALGLLLSALHNTLQSLMLPAESTPVLTLSHLHWPRLRELRIFGERCIEVCSRCTEL
ncbi:hypothetical protein C8Q80DRAFT_679416 [Daedaleopsis nitida]|nr:hypothetical protein C8Q80DRAFT_679416 [Daedaleopsis nitida]